MDSRIESLEVQQQRARRRDALRLEFHRNQAYGLLLTAVALLVYRLWQAPSGSIFHEGWWAVWRAGWWRPW